MSVCDHDHSHAPGLHGGSLAHALADAERRCGAAGERLTAPRRRVLELLLEAGGPVKAYDLMALFGGTAGETAKPPTVYRALDFLGRTGLAHRIESLNAYMACRLGETSHAAGFLICDCCGAAREIDRLPADWVTSAAEEAGYQLSRVTVEAHGLCGDCAAA
jgi:Fur family zinc uptake transcriptional regulator